MDNNNNMVTKQVTSGTKVEAIGTVKIVVGEVKAIDPSGNERLLQAGDKVYPNETIITAVGALVLIEFINGTHLDLPSASQIVLDSDVFDPSLATAGAGTGELTAEQIQEMIARGEDPTAITEATAAGAGAGDEGGASFIVVDFNNAEGQVTSGFNTLGIPGPESTTFTELPPVEEEPAPSPPPAVPPTVSVSVDIGVGPGGEGTSGVVLIPPGTVIPVGGVTAINIPEGTSDGGTHPVTFLITLSAPSTEPITITYHINSGTASNPDDYFDGAVTGTVTIPPGHLGFAVTENIVEDMLPEANETFTITLSNPIGVTLLNDTATVTIIDDDVTLAAQGAAGDETDGLVTLGGVLGANYGPGDSGSITLSATGATWTPGNNTLAANDGSWTLVVHNDGTYTFTQLAPFTHPVTTNPDDPLSIQITAVATDSAGNTSAPAVFTITVDDDGPTAANDGPAGVTEDGTSVVSGNVLTNDASGADTAKVFDTWSAVGHDNSAALTELSKYGSLVQNGDGSWSYTLNNADADTQALTSASSLSYDLWYTMKDADGDPSPAKLTITITGANDNASVVTAATSGPDNTVFEAGLNPNGSNAASTSETSTGSFTVTATDGILNIVIGGTTYTLAQMQAFNGTQIVNTGEGVLTLTGYSGTATSGTVNYSYTVSATIDNDSKAGATGTQFDDSV
ncbi:MAG: retention module-containing protein, partial [Methylophilaceae bacterium]